MRLNQVKCYMPSGYVPKFEHCDCGSTTYAFYHKTQNIFFNLVEYLLCGGCGKTHFVSELPISFVNQMEKA